MVAEQTKEFKREAGSKALLAVDEKALNKFKKQKERELALKSIPALIDRINTLEETVLQLKNQLDILTGK